MTFTGKQFLYSRAQRLDGPHAYTAVFAFKCWVSGQLFSVYARPNGRAGARLGIVVSKRVIPAAIARNYCKRLVREVFRVECAGMAGLDLVVRPRAGVTRAFSAVACAEIAQLLHRARSQCHSRSEALAGFNATTNQPDQNG